MMTIIDILWNHFIIILCYRIRIPYWYTSWWFSFRYFLILIIICF